MASAMSSLCVTATSTMSLSHRRFARIEQSIRSGAAIPRLRSMEYATWVKRTLRGRADA
jgi:hypothetical protein